MSTAREIRARARDTLGGNIFSSEWLYALLITLIASAVTGVASVVAIIIYGPVSIGLANYFLNRTRRRIPHDSFDYVLDGFRYNLADNMITGILVNIFTFLWTLLFIVPGIIKGLSYSLTYYVKCDYPELTPMQAIQMSEVMMKGHKFRLFCLNLSFIGWIIVGALCLGVGTLWVTAYMNAAMAEFYEEVKNSQPNT